MAPGFGRAITSAPVRVICGGFGLFLLGLAIYAGYEGTEAPDRNIALTLLFVTAWLGFPLLGVLFGNLFPAFNPWNALTAPVGLAWRKVTGGAPPHLSYPEKLGRWPAVVGLFLFVWLELIYGQSSGVAVGVSPHVVVYDSLIYEIYTLAMVGLFGRETWFRNGETFSVYFGMFGSLGKLQVRGRELGSRRFLEGATTWAAAIPGSVALVITSMGVFKDGIDWLIDRLADLGLGATAAVRASSTTFMLLSVGLVALVYLAGVRGMGTIPGAPDRRTLWQSFAHALIPIAFAYLVAHYFSLFFFQEQAQFTYLLSDPLGTGSTDIFGTAGYGINYNAISNELVWYVQVAALLAGHVAGLVLAHDKAITIWKDYRTAARSQYWMLAVMVAFTCFGLFLLSVSNS